MISTSKALQISLFATGCSGIVSEFVLSTLATYLIGNATFQWTMIMSIMLFAMGAGSRYSRNFKNHLLDTFIFSEFLLSSLCAVSSVIAFSLSTQIESRELVIYPLAFSIGFLIGLEIPLVTRINSSYQELGINISKVLEMDYFGSLAGGILFAFFSFHYLALSIHRFYLGASILLWHHGLCGAL
ncbi:putative spermidine synthase 2 (fragment) [Desulfamplus magnetovallimortis]|uniref:Putative spermidine synthase 2 n=1 Tax=Desulfamplus magnetovallimortis TaxID=1246637 RepID=A0A1W1HEN3_9BACT